MYGPAAKGSAQTFAALLQGAKAGNQRSWVRLYESLAPRVRGYLRSRGCAEPDDALGEVFLHLARGIATFEGDEAAFRSWVFVVAHHRILDERRRQRRRPSHVVDPNVDFANLADPLDVEDEALRGPRLDELRNLLARLTDSQRNVLELRLIAGLTIDEVAEVLEKPAGAVKALQHRAIQAIHRADHGTAVLTYAGVSL
jgi:RNA polymerase sigma-70 factor (ECF subfamily)